MKKATFIGKGMSGLFFMAMMLSHATETAHSEEVDLRNSQWHTTYTTPQGQKVGTRLTLRGDRGRYVTRSGAQGTLYSIRYASEGDGRNVPRYEVARGRWKFENGARGTFKLYVRGDAFYGMWSDQGERGSVHPWGGTLVGAERKSWVGKPSIADAGSVSGVSQAFRLPGGRLFSVTFHPRTGRILKQEIQRLDQ